MKLEAIRALIENASDDPARTWASLSLDEQIILVEAKSKLQAASRTLLPKLLAVAEAAKSFMREGKSYDETERCHDAMEEALTALEAET